MLTPRGGRKPASLALTIGSGQSGYPWARIHRVSLSSLLSAASSCASANGSCGGAFLAQAVAAELDVEFYHTERVATTGGGLYPVNYRLPDTLRHRISGKRVAIVDDAINAGSAVRARLRRATAATEG